MNQILNRFKLVLISILFFVFYIYAKLIPYVIVSYILISVLSLKLENIRLLREYNKYILILFFLVNLVSLIYSENFECGFFNIQTQLSLVFLTLLIILDKDFYIEYKRIIISLFALLSLISTLFLALRFIYLGGLGKVILATDLYNLFQIVRYYELASYQHPSYISMAYLFSAILIWQFPLKISNLYIVFIKGFLSSLIIIFIFLLNSRAALLSILFVILYYALKYLVESRAIYKIIALTIILFCFYFIFSISRFKENLITLNSATTIEQIDIRFSLWKNAFIVWKEEPLFGHGIGDTQKAIVKVHQKRNLFDAAESKLNAHNQFLETVMQTGLVGLIILLLVFAVPLYQSIKKKQELLFLFLMICFINFLFESMLQRLAGVVFFAFWYSFLWFVYYKDDEKKELN